LWNTLAEVEDALRQASKREDPSASTHLDALRYVTALVRSHSDPSDPGPYSSVGLTQVSQTMTQIAQEIRNYAQNGNTQHLVNAVIYSDQLLLHLGSWPTLPPRGGAASQAQKAFREYRESADSAIRELRETTQTLLSDLGNKEQESRASILELRSEIATLSAKIAQDESRLDTALTTSNEAFNSKQTEREEKFAKFVAEQSARLSELAHGDLEQLRQFVASGQHTYEQIDALRQGTEKVAGMASADILAGKFESYSRKQWGWGIAANVLGFLALAVGLTVVALTLRDVGVNDAVSWQYTTLKLGITATIAGASAVAFRLGSSFLARANQSKSMELELRAIGPFFADVDDNDALKEAKKAFVERSFGRGWGDTSRGAPHQSTEDMNARLGEAILKTLISRSSA